MRSSNTPLARPVLAAVAGALVLLCSAAVAQTSADKGADKNVDKAGDKGGDKSSEKPAERPAGTPVDAAAACERAVLQSLPGAQRADVSFNTAPALQPNLSAATQAVLRGSGRVRQSGSTRAFTYSCNVDLTTSEAIGVVVRQTPPAGSETAARPAVEPDLSQLSPQACESRAAEALKRRWPSVSQISFDATTRSLRQEAADRAELRGQGHALPTPNSPSTFFGFGCMIDPRDGRVLSAQVSG